MYFHFKNTIFYLKFYYVYECFAWMYFCTQLVCLVPLCGGQRKLAGFSSRLP